MSWGSDGGKGNGGGPWGGSNSPWGKGNGGKGGGQKPPHNHKSPGPDLDEIKRKVERFSRDFKPGGGVSWGILGLGLVVLIGLWLASGIYEVDAGERGVVLQFGERSRQTQPGLHYHLPYPIEEVILVSVEEQRRVEVSRNTNNRDTTEILTGNESFVDIEYSITWRISDPFDFLFNIVDPELTIRAIGESTMREIIGERNFNEIIGIDNNPGAEAANSQQRAQKEIELRVSQSLQETLNALKAGVEIRQVNIIKILPPETVIPSVNAVQIAQSEARRLENQANAEANRRIPIARGEAVEVIGKARGEAAKIIGEAEGQATRFLAVLQEYQKSPDVVYQRLYTETMAKIFGSANTTLIDGNLPGTILVPYGTSPLVPGLTTTQK